MATDRNTEDAELLAWFNKTMPSTWRVFEGDNASDLAKALATQQKERWLKIFDVFPRSEGGVWGELVKDIKTAILESEPASIKKTGSSYIVERSIPLILRDLDSGTADKILNFQIFAITYIALHCRAVIPFNDKPTLFSFLIASATAKQEIGAALPSWVPDEEKVGQIADSVVDSALHKYQKLFDSIDQKVADTKVILDQQSDKVNVFFRDAATKDEERKRLWENEKVELAEAIRREALEFTKVESSLNLWRDKASGHFVFFGVCAAIFAATLVAIPWFVVGRGIPFVSELAKSFAGDKEYLGLALLIIPALSVAWLLRFVARLSIQNLSLAQDARQRHAQIATYLRLLGDPMKPISEHERILALSAIFRPTAGQGSDDVNPPTIADLFKEALEKTVVPKV